MKPALLALIVCLLSGCTSRSAPRPEATGELQTLDHDGRTRTYLLRMPPSDARPAPLPLVLVLHGGGGNALNAERMTGFTALARSEGFIVVYPEGSARGRLRLLTWNAGHCCGYAMESGSDDVGFLRLLIGELSRRHPIDPDRIFVTGMSNGAMLAHRLGIELEATIAAIAPVAGGLFGDEPRGDGKVSALMINGMLDRSVPYGGGAPGGRFAHAWAGTPVKPAGYQARFWAQANGCADPGSTEYEAIVHVRFSCPEGLGVELYGVKNGGHAWPGGEQGSRLADAPTPDLNATGTIWAFFAAHPKRW